MKNRSNGFSWQNKGFSLIELFLAMAIVFSLAVVSNGVYRQARDRLRQMREQTARGTQLDSALALMRKDFRSAYIGIEDKAAIFAGRRDIQTGQFRLDFVRTGPDEGAFWEIGYFISTEPTGEHQLWRREQEIVDADVLDGGRVRLLCRNVERAEFCFFDGDGWRWNWGWDTETNRPRRGIRGLPLALAFEITWRSDDGLEQTAAAFFPVMVPLLNHRSHV